MHSSEESASFYLYVRTFHQGGYPTRKETSFSINQVPQYEDNVMEYFNIIEMLQELLSTNESLNNTR